MRKWFILFTIAVAVSHFCSLIKLEHLESLGYWFEIAGKPVKGYWVYAERGVDGYKPIGATNEGDFCVDDVARAVLLYCELFEHTNDPKYLNLAIDGSSFLLAMQSEDGEFYNFAYKDGSINMYGPTSVKSTSWWTLRAFWALAKLANLVNDADIHDAVHKTYRAISKRPPTYMDQKAVYLLGLCEYNKLSNVEKSIRAIADDLLGALIREGPFAGFFSYDSKEFRWHGWGNRYSEALLKAYQVTGDTRYLTAAVFSLERQVPLLLGSGFIYSIEKYVDLFPELSYAVEPLVVSCSLAYEITNDRRYAVLAALSGAWYFGVNRLQRPMYGPNGEGYDGMEYAHINMNAGAESTICALRAMVYLSELPEEFRRLAQTAKLHGMKGIRVLEAENADPGVSAVSNVFGDYSAGAAVAYESRTRLKWTDTNQRGSFYVLIAGEFSKSSVSVQSGDSAVSAELNGKGIFLLGEMEMTDTVRASLSGKGTLDQVVLVPKEFGISIVFDNRPMSVVWSQEGLKITNDLIFEPLKRENIFEAKVDLLRVGQFVALVLDEFFNNDGIAAPLEPGNFDNLGGSFGAYYPEELIPEQFALNGVPFVLKKEGKDNMRCNSQVLLIEPAVRVTRVHILASANHGDYKALMFLNDQAIPIVVSDWCRPPKDYELEYRYVQSGEKQYISCGFDHIVVELEEPVELHKIVLPNEINIHVFAITLEPAG